MTLNGVIRCSSCDKISKKLGSKDGKCSMCLELEQLRKEVLGLRKMVVHLA